MKILIIEDQENLAKLIRKGLAAEGITSDYVLDGHEGQKRIDLYHEDYDLVILDFMLPQKNGLEIVRTSRKKNIAIPILMLTAKDDKCDITSCLNSGADDYLTKPFSFDELLARIRAILRRPKISLSTELKIKNIVLNPTTQTVICSGKTIHLTLKEFGLLEYLMRNPNKALSRDHILSNVWDFAFDSFANVVDVHIASLRKKLGDQKASLIETVRGIGYKINSD